MSRYKKGDKVLYLDPKRVYEVGSVDTAHDRYEIVLQDSNITLTIGSVPDDELRPETYVEGEEVEYLDPSHVYKVAPGGHDHTYTIEPKKGSKPSPIGPVPDGLIRPH